MSVAKLIFDHAGDHLMVGRVDLIIVAKESSVRMLMDGRGNIPTLNPLLQL